MHRRESVDTIFSKLKYKCFKGLYIGIVLSCWLICTNVGVSRLPRVTVSSDQVLGLEVHSSVRVSSDQVLGLEVHSSVRIGSTFKC